MKILGVRATHVRVPLDTPYVNARGAMRAFDSVVVRIDSDAGLVGVGESCPFNFSAGDPRAREADAAVLARLVNGPIAGALRGADPLDIEALLSRALALAGDTIDAVGGVDLALWDLAGRHLGQPVYRLLGGRVQDPIPIDYTIGARTPEETAEIARRACEDGYHGVVVKVPATSMDEDVARVRAVRGVLPPGRSLRVDCNTGYSRDAALRFIRRIAEFDVEFVEQPVAAADLDGMRMCRGAGVRVSADESLNTLGDAIALVRHEACDVMNIKVPKVGGLLLSKRMAAVAAAAGMPVVVGGRTTLEICRAASRHFAASTPVTTGRAHEGPGPASQALTDDVVRERTTWATVKAGGGRGVGVEQSPGLGVDVMWEKVARYAVPA